jgi:probable addiction module antidote protein
MPKIKTTKYDVAEYLNTPEEMAAYLEACLEEANGDAAFVAKALGNIARAKGMSEIARETGLSRESLYKSLSGGRSPRSTGLTQVKAQFGDSSNEIQALGLTKRSEYRSPTRRQPTR